MQRYSHLTDCRCLAVLKIAMLAPPEKLCMLSITTVTVIYGQKRNFLDIYPPVKNYWAIVQNGACKIEMNPCLMHHKKPIKFPNLFLLNDMSSGLKSKLLNCATNRELL